MAIDDSGDMFSTPVIAGANNYTAQTVGETGFPAQVGQFVAALPGAVASDVINSSGAIIKFFGGEGCDTD